MFSADGELVGAAALSGEAVVIELAGSADPIRIETGPDRLHSLTFAPDGDSLATGDTGGNVKLWSLEGEPELATELDGPANWVYSLAFLPGMPFLVTGSSDGLRVWNTETNAEPLSLPSNGPVTDVVIDPTDGAVYAGYADGSVKRWQLPGPVLTSPTGIVFDVEFLSEERTIAVAAGDDGVWLWDATDPSRTTLEAVLRSPDPESWLVGAVTTSPDGSRIAAAGHDGRIWLWDRDDLSAPSTVLNGLDDFAEQLMFSPTGLGSPQLAPMERSQSGTSTGTASP
ncbi:hypothetical protein GCM10029992_37210 [Glycomyces albus]